jgi:hypothetical protein
MAPTGEALAALGRQRVGAALASDPARHTQPRGPCAAAVGGFRMRAADCDRPLS